ncbi:energy transducer TonB [Rhodanobacter lindaniclasticus]
MASRSDRLDQCPRHGANLIHAASDTVTQHWRFQPELKDGKPVQGYARIPISFRSSKPAPTSSSDTPTSDPASSKTSDFYPTC